MRLSTSRVLSLDSNSGLSTLGCPTRASMAVPPRAAFGTVATGWQAPRTRTAANAAAISLCLEMRRDPDVGDRAGEEGDDNDPGRPVDLALEAATGPVPTAEPGVAATDGATEPRRLGRLDEHPGRQEDGQHGLRDHQSVLQLCHGAGFYLDSL